jgi:flagellar hook-length control protein FliK
MSDMPIMSNHIPSNSKMAITTNTTNDAVSETSPVMQVFGDVLARQFSTQEASDLKKRELSTAEISGTESLARLKDDTQEKDVFAFATSPTSLPSDMLAALPPLTADIAQLNPLPTTPTSDAPSVQTHPSKLDSIEVMSSQQRSGSLPVSTFPAPSSPIVSSLPSVKETTLQTVSSVTQSDNAVPMFTGKADVKDASTPPPLISGGLMITKVLDTHSDPNTVSEPISPQAMLPQIAPLQSMVSTTPIVTQATQLLIDTPVNHPRWSDDFSQKITWMATQQEQHAELHLNPAQLGPVDVVIKVSGDQATAQFTSAHATVREAIEQSIPKLREMLADNGIMLGNATVSDQAPREQRGEFGDPRQATPSGRAPESAPSNMNDIRAVAPPSRHNGMVDTFA